MPHDAMRMAAVVKPSDDDIRVFMRSYADLFAVGIPRTDEDVPPATIRRWEAEPLGHVEDIRAFVNPILALGRRVVDFLMRPSSCAHLRAMQAPDVGKIFVMYHGLVDVVRVELARPDVDDRALKASVALALELIKNLRNTSKGVLVQFFRYGEITVEDIDNIRSLGPDLDEFFGGKAIRDMIERAAALSS